MVGHKKMSVCFREALFFVRRPCGAEGTSDTGIAGATKAISETPAMRSRDTSENGRSRDSEQNPMQTAQAIQGGRRVARRHFFEPVVKHGLDDEDDRELVPVV
jgi:hypothetical protein